MRALPALCVAAAWMLAGCAGLGPSLAPKPLPASELRPAEAHALYLDREGFLLHPKTGQRLVQRPEDGPAQGDSPADEALRSAYESQPPERRYVQKLIDAFFVARAARPGLQLTLHIHGGLNEFDDLSDRSRLLPGHMLRDGQYPVFVGWRSALMSNLADHVWRNSRGVQRHGLEQVVAPPFVVLEDLARAVLRTPMALLREVNQALTVSISNYSPEEAAAETRTEALRGSGLKLVSNGPYTGVGGSYWSVANPVKLISAPLVDGVGSGAWQAMLRRTDLVLTKALVYEGGAPNKLDETQLGGRDSAAHTAVTQFLLLWGADPRSRGVPVNLIAHSMGAIVALNILARHPELNIDHLVFMGAAARIKDLETVLLPWLTAHPEARFYNLSLDPYNEIAERFYLDIAPRGSLLNWIDNIFGQVNSFRDRTAGSWWNIVRIADDLFPRSRPGPAAAEGPAPEVPIRQRITLKRFPIGEDLGPQRHGDFNDHCFWRPSFWRGEAPSPPLVKQLIWPWSSKPGWVSCADQAEPAAGP